MRTELRINENVSLSGDLEPIQFECRTSFEWQNIIICAHIAIRDQIQPLCVINGFFVSLLVNFNSVLFQILVISVSVQKKQ